MMRLLLALSCRRKGTTLLPYVTCSVLFATPLVAQPSPTLTPKDVDEAIQWGLTSDPSPYLPCVCLARLSPRDAQKRRIDRA